MYVGRKLCKKNFKLFKRTILGILFAVLLVLKPLVVNGSIPLSRDLMGHLTDTKQGWWHSEIDKSMELIMMRHLHRWQK